MKVNRPAHNRLTVQIDCGNGQIAQVVAKPSDDPVLLARAFCAQYGFEPTLIIPLSAEIQKNMDLNFQEIPQVTLSERWASPNLETLKENSIAIVEEDCTDD